jgi:hypothetical protein
MRPPYLVCPKPGAPVEGPHSLRVLRQQAEILVLTPGSLVRPAEASDEPWRPIEAIPDLFALLFPPRTEPRPQLSANPGANIVRTNAATDAANAPINVINLLQENRAHEALAEQNLPRATRRRRGLSGTSNRPRDFLLVLAVLWGALTYAVLNHRLATEQLVVLGLGAAFVSLMVYWVLFHVADRY